MAAGGAVVMCACTWRGGWGARRWARAHVLQIRCNCTRVRAFEVARLRGFRLFERRHITVDIWQLAPPRGCWWKRRNPDSGSFLDPAHHVVRLVEKGTIIRNTLARIDCCDNSPGVQSLFRVKGTYCVVLEHAGPLVCSRLARRVLFAPSLTLVVEKLVVVSAWVFTPRLSCDRFPAARARARDHRPSSCIAKKGIEAWDPCMHRILVATQKFAGGDSSREELRLQDNITRQASHPALAPPHHFLTRTQRCLAEALCCQRRPASIVRAAAMPRPRAPCAQN